MDISAKKNIVRAWLEGLTTQRRGAILDNKLEKARKHWYVTGKFVSVCSTDLMALDRLLDLLAHRFFCFRFIFLCFSYSYMCGRQNVGQLPGQLLSTIK